MRPLFLICNDDGYGWRGLETLAAVARECDADVVVVAPDRHQSAKASAITIAVPLRAEVVHDEPGYKVITVNGTPADCVKLALDQLLDGREPTLLLTGINHGYNNGINTHYSGTIGAAMEGTAHHVPAIAFSLGDHDPNADMEACKPWLRLIIDYAMAHPFAPEVCLNVNIPCGEIKGLRVTKADTGRWMGEFQPSVDGYGRTVYWVTGDYQVADPTDTDTDIYWNNNGYISIVPCQLDRTAHSYRAALDALNRDF